MEATQNRFPKVLKQEKAVSLLLSDYFTPELLLCSEFETFFLLERMSYRRFTVQAKLGAAVTDEAEKK